MIEANPNAPVVVHTFAAGSNAKVRLTGAQGVMRHTELHLSSCWGHALIV